MRKLLAIGVCLGLLLVGYLAEAKGSQIRRDPGDAFPWGAEIPFPWKGIQGTWMANIDGEYHYFTFEVVKYTDGVNQLHVNQFGERCDFISHGAGYEQNRVVRAMMVGDYGPYNLTVHVFRQADLKHQEQTGNLIVRGSRTVTVLKISPVAGNGQVKTYQLFKVSNQYCGVCPGN